ncbi:MAG: Tol-Pal system beta propeller repeat protein TolB [Alphaproteobacteria bacterium]
MKLWHRITILLLALLAFAGPARADLHVDITEGYRAPMPVAITSLFGDNPQETQVGQDIAGVISADLDRSGLFKSIDPKAFIQSPASLRVAPNFGEWRTINATALVTGTAKLQADGQLRVEFRLWDVFGGQQMLGYAYSAAPQYWRRLAHKIADAVYKRLTGEEGYFDTRVVYISESGPANRRQKRLAIMDQDGANHRFLTDGRYLTLTPRFSPTLQEITYFAYVNERARVYLLSVDSGKQEVLGDFPGMTFAPRFSPDGNKIILSMAQDGNTDIYVMDLRTRRVTRLTSGNAIDTSPAYSPDGKQIVFNSDRGGSQQLYVMDADGSNVRRISFGQGRYATPVWSPRGDLIAFTKIHQGQFFIGVMRPDGSGERLLTNGFLVEGPTWAPNGRVLMYFRQSPMDARGQGGNARLYSIDLTGHNEREIVTPLDGSDPAWSPLIP